MTDHSLLLTIGSFLPIRSAPWYLDSSDKAHPPAHAVVSQLLRIDMSLKHHLDAEHLEPLKQALNNLLSTTIAKETYAQIVDGMPIASVYAEDHWFREGLPVMQHEELCPGVLEKTRSFGSQFDILSLEVPPKVEITYPEKLCYSRMECEANLST